jgi:Cys-tRNA(Pro)/Cys-tRNA(Cys) deacylase
VSRTTPATVALDRAGVAYTLATYDYDPDADSIGLAAAEALGVPPGEMLKTLIVKADGKPACVVLASDREVSMKKLAAALGAKSAEMAPVAEAERITGYRVGGVSPMGQKKRLPTVIDAAAAALPLAFVNGGQTGPSGPPRAGRSGPDAGRGGGGGHGLAADQAGSAYTGIRSHLFPQPPSV